MLKQEILKVILDPLVSIPAHETWLFKNKRASALVKQGLEEAKMGRLIKAKEDFSKYAKGKGGKSPSSPSLPILKPQNKITHPGGRVP